MAIGDSLAAVLKKGASQEFVPQTFHEQETDSLMFYARDEPSYAKRISKYFTVFLSRQDDSLVGIEIKGLSLILKSIGDLDYDVEVGGPVTISDENGDKCELSVLMRIASAKRDTPITDIYEELESITEGVTYSTECCV